MAQKNIDGVIECVRYKPSGGLDVARLYLRRGATYSDSILLDRESLVSSLQKGKRFVIGERLTSLGSTFKIGPEIRLVKSGETDILIVNQASSNQDDLTPAPLF